MKDRLTVLFSDLGQRFKEREVASTAIIPGQVSDVHAFYRLTQMPTRTIHVQGYTGFSTREGAVVMGRLMDTDIMMEMDESGESSIGNEHRAVVQVFPNLQGLTDIPYDAKVLDTLLSSNVQELNP
jgi:hypothetical protein